MKISINYKKLTGIFFAILLSSISVNALNLTAGGKKNSIVAFNVSDITLTENGNINIKMDADLSHVKMKSNLETVYTPMLVNGSDTIRFESFSITGRKRFISDRRNKRLPYYTFYKGNLYVKDEKVSKAQYVNTSVAKALRSSTWNIELTTKYKPWMESAVFMLKAESRGCANCLKKVKGINTFTPIAETDFKEIKFTPELIYVTPVAEAVKLREISARAYVDFPVNKIEIYPDYRNNEEELGKIISTIDSVKNDKDITVKSLHISGTASPEGSYENNVYLAKNRTQSLRDYVRILYKFPAGFITTSYEPVDWTGLRDYLINGELGGNVKRLTYELPHREAILAIVNSGLPDYDRNQRIKNGYPEEYNWLLKNVYPALRHSDYTISFEIKNYTQIEEILQIMETAPQKLSLNELFVAAKSMPEGSPQYQEAFEIAVRMYPKDETANLNAGVNAISRGDLLNAQRFISKAGESDEAIYARALMKYLLGNSDEALKEFDILSYGNGTTSMKAKEAADGIRNTLTKKKFKTF